MTPQQIIFAHNKKTFETRIYGIAFVPMTDKNPSFWKFWRTNFMLEPLRSIVNKPVKIEASGISEREALQAFLGADWVLCNEHFIHLALKDFVTA